LSRQVRGYGGAFGVADQQHRTGRDVRTVASFQRGQPCSQLGHAVVEATKTVQAALRRLHDALRAQDEHVPAEHTAKAATLPLGAIARPVQYDYDRPRSRGAQRQRQRRRAKVFDWQLGRPAGRGEWRESTALGLGGARGGQEQRRRNQ
jgi:hypothetical protein